MPAVPTSISAHVAALPAPRVERTMTHLLLNIEAVALCAVLRGADKGATVAAFGRAKEPWLRIFLAPPHGIPSHDTRGVRPLLPGMGGRCRPLDDKTARLARRRDGAGGAAPGPRVGGRIRAGAGPTRRGRQVQRDHRHPPRCWRCSIWPAAR